VSAKDLASGRKQGITITASNKLSKDDVAKMVSQAEQFADADKARADLVIARNQAESLAYEAERLLTDSKDKIDAADAESVREKVKALRAAIESKDGNPADLRAKTDDLTSSLHAIAKKMYQAASPPPGSASAPPDGEGSTSPPPEHDAGPTGPVDADFKVVDKDVGDEKQQL
jgi:molecular chaperone DnaK